MSLAVTPRPTTPVVAVIISGGNVHNIMSTSPIEAVLVDYDTMGCEDTDPSLVDVEQEGGGTERACVGFYPSELDAKGTAKLKQAALEAEGRTAAAQDQPIWPPVLPFEQAFTNILNLVVEEFHRRLMDSDNYVDQQAFNAELEEACGLALRLLTGQEAMSDALREGLFSIANDAGITWSQATAESA